jgi:cellulose synthase/poly-beta-1,6-N-acetylglucosamine synthase-like glycosyltransferase
MIVEAVFWLSLVLIAYTYGGYALFISLLSILPWKPVRRAAIEPKVSLIIAAYNEEKDLGRKIENSFELDYPADRLEIIVASDGSTDSTDEIARSYATNDRGVRVVLHRVEGRKGKTAAQNSAVKAATGEIVVFSDAASMYDRNAVRSLVRNYADPTVGAVSGQYHYLKPKQGSVGFATMLFWKFENFIKSRQTRIQTITGCCGCIYSVRKRLYTDLPAEIISDLVEPLAILRQGYRIVFEPEALAYEEPTEKPKDEFKMRVRVIVRGMNGLLFMRTLLNPFKFPFVSFQLISHKVLRWLIPCFCITAFLSNLWLSFDSPFYRVLLWGQFAFYGLALVGFVLDSKGIRSKIFYLPMYFTIVNSASLVSLFKVAQGEKIVVWQTQR